MAAIPRTTETVLSRSRNRAVLPVLAAALRSSSAEVRAAAIRATLRRTDRESHTQLIRQFEKLSPDERNILCEAYRAAPHNAGSALSAAIRKGNQALCENACRIIILCREYELLPILVKAAADTQHRHPSHLAAAVSELAQLLHDEIAAWAAGGRRAGSDPTFARHRVLAALERALASYDHHHRAELLHAFLLLAPSEDATLLRIMREDHHPCHAPMTAALTSNKVRGVIERLVALLRDIDAPLAALDAIASRTDRAFVQTLFRELKRPVPLRVLHNMQRLRSVAWLESHREILLELDGRAQAMAVDLALASGIEEVALFELLAFLLQNGLAEGRRAACQALARFDRAAAHDLVLAALKDPDAGVQAAAARQLRQRRLPNALETLVTLLESPSVEVREAARSSLAEFNFARYRAMFDHLDEQAARTTGLLVRQVDPSAREKLIAELASPAVTTRLRAIEMAIAMQGVDDVHDQLIDLIGHENATTRQEAAAALAYASGPAVVEALELATRDSNHSVVAAAQHSLEQLRLREVVTGQSVHAAVGDAP